MATRGRAARLTRRGRTQRSATGASQRIENYRSRVEVQDAVLRLRLAVEDLICESRRNAEDVITEIRRSTEDLVNPSLRGGRADRRQARADDDRRTRLARQAADEWKGEMVALHFKLARALDRVAEDRFRKGAGL